MKRRVVLVIRGDDGFSKKLRQYGFEVRNLELVRTQPVDDLSDFIKTIRRIGEYDGIFITSPAAAEIFVRHLNDTGLTFSGKLYVLGERSRAILEKSGYQPAGADTANTAEELIRSFGMAEFTGKRLLYIRGDRSIGTISNMLEGVASIEEEVVYRTKEHDPGDAVVAEMTRGLRDSEFEAICFFSPSGVAGFKKLFAAVDLGKMKAATIGETTARSAGEAGFQVDFVSQRATAEDFAAGFAAHFKEIE